MRVKSTLVLRPPRNDNCIVCLEPTIGFMWCCGCSMCPDCLLGWANEANTCPHCNHVIHAGEDRRHRNIDNPPPEVPAFFFLEHIYHYLRDRRRLINFQENHIRQRISTAMETYPQGEPAVITVPGLSGDSVFTVDLSNPSGANLLVVDAPGRTNNDLEALDEEMTSTSADGAQETTERERPPTLEEQLRQLPVAPTITPQVIVPGGGPGIMRQLARLGPEAQRYVLNQLQGLPYSES
jgi:hypothetical protein